MPFLGVGSFAKNHFDFGFDGDSQRLNLDGCQRSDDTNEFSFQSEELPPIPMHCIETGRSTQSPYQILIHEDSILPEEVNGINSVFPPNVLSPPVDTPNTLSHPLDTANILSPPLSRHSSEDSISSVSILSNISHISKSVMENILPSAQTKGVQVLPEESHNVQKGVIFGILSFFLLSNLFGFLKSRHLTYCWHEEVCGCSNTPSILTGVRIEILSLCHEWVMIFNVCNGIGLSLEWSFKKKSVLFIYTIVSSIIIKSFACYDAPEKDCVRNYPVLKLLVHIISYFLFGYYCNRMAGITNQLFLSAMSRLRDYFRYSFPRCIQSPVIFHLYCTITNGNAIGSKSISTS